jgi:DNA-binding CsgD family transcriptional regulator
VRRRGVRAGRKVGAPTHARAKPGDALTIVETAYSLQGNEDAWLTRVGEAVFPLLDRGLGLVAYFFQAGKPARTWGFQALGSDSAFAAFAAATANSPVGQSDAFIERMYRGPRSFAYASGEMGRDLMGTLRSAFPSLFERMTDVLSLRPANVSGAGCVFCGMERSPRPLPAAQVAKMERVASHVAAALRLRRALTAMERPPDGEAVLTLEGEVAHADGQAKARDARERLRAAVRAMDRARGSLRRRDEHEALDLWKGLVDGRWTLVDRFDTDGKHYVVAHPNDERVGDLRALTAREGQVAAQAAIGRPSKVIAYNLGLSQGTVGGLLTSAFRKLGVESRAELPRLAGSLGVGWITPPGNDAPALAVARAPARAALAEGITPAEREVLDLAIAGHSNAAIAARRRVSVRTVANQLAAIYQKLGVSSRTEAAARLTKRG